MSLIRRFASNRAEVLFLAWVVAGCAGGNPPPGGGSPPGAGGAPADPGGPGPGTGGTPGFGGTPGQGNGGAAGGSGGSGGAVGNGGSGGSGGGPVAPDAGGGGGPDVKPGTGGPDVTPGTAPDVTPGTTVDAGPGGAVVDSGTPMGTRGGGPQPSYAGEIPLYYGPEVGPIVKMECPGDPTQGWTEYKDSFNVQRPYNVAINTRFSIIDGIYNFWVFPPDAPHSPTANGRNPRTEARYGGTADSATGKNFTTGMRMWTGDMMVERNAVNSAIFQIHTTADGGGPIGVRIHSNSDMVNNGSLTVVQGSSVAGGLIDRWFNFKASLDTSTLEVKIYINNCLKSTYKGPRGDGNFYFKHGVYFCKTSTNGCYSHYKNIRLYRK
jgi:hypothetical protein